MFSRIERRFRQGTSRAHVNSKIPFREIWDQFRDPARQAQAVENG